MIEFPPQISQEEYLKVLLTDPLEKLKAIIEKNNDKYSYWSDVKYQKAPEGISSKELWCYIKASRRAKRIIVWKKYGISISITNAMQRMCHEFDMNFGGSWGSNSIIPAENKEQYLISSLMEEAISSSQMEGAATTRKVAKEMLRKSLSPQDKSQQMIFNNYQTIRFITQNIHTPLSSELLQQIHVLMTEKTLENPADAGAYRTNDEVVVEDAITHEVVHTPPSYKDIPSFIEDLCIFFNESDSKVFIHPIIRGIIIHFMIAYMHPFVDGNGRTARALFYWYMLKSGYWLTEYLSISRVIAKSKKSYENAYLYTEADEKDMGYFIAYNLRVLELAFKELQTYIKRKLDQKHQASVFYKLDNINERQADILRLFYDNPKILFTVIELQNSFSITHTTAKNDIDGLVERKLVDEISLNKVKKGYVKGELFDKTVKSIT